MTPRPLARTLAGALVVLALAPAAAQAVTTTRTPTIAPLDEPKRVGQGLAADDGEFSYEDPATASTSRQWLRCNASGTDCNALLATGGAYEPTAADAGSTIRLRVTATCDTCAPAIEDSQATGVIRTDPSNEQPPAISGPLLVGKDLELVTGEWAGSQSIVFGIQWQRCAGVEENSCVDIDGATEDYYTVKPLDVGRRIRVRVTADNSAPGSVTSTSEISGPVGAQVLFPFPLVAIAGELSRGGTQLSLLRVRGPVGAIASIRCRGATCPSRGARRRIGRSGVLRFRRFERRLDGGTRIEVTVATASLVGKYTRFRIRHERLPTRVDACIRPGSSRASACP